jgi:NAD(P)-dependent dehydrogenase (short-subunit alcohol dehydrogenase family)
MPNALASRVIVAIGHGTPEHRALVVALAESGADVVVAGPSGMPYEVLLNSISNEVWAIGRRSLALGFDDGDARSFATALSRAESELGRVDFVVRVEPVISA